MTSWRSTLAGWAKRPAMQIDAASAALVADARAAARLREHQLDANVTALTIERTRDRLDRWGWAFLFAGLAFTTVNVQGFISGTATVGSLRWGAAWLVEPMVMGLMLVLLRGEQVANRHGEHAGHWVKITRWVCLLITYMMNTTEDWSRSDIVEGFIHSAPVLLVFLAAEALVQQRLSLTSVVDGLWLRTSSSSPRRRSEVESLSPTSSPLPPYQASQTAQDESVEPKGSSSTPDELTEPRTLKERAFTAFCELVDEGRPPDQIGPAEVDRRAEVRPGTAKVPGRMQEFRTRWTAKPAPEEVGQDDEKAG